MSPRRCGARARGRGALAAALALGALAGGAGRADAQDIEALSALRGIPLPVGYYERLRQDPEAFELPNGLFRMTPAGPEPVAALEGTARLPVILALFSDSRQPHVQPQEVAASLFTGPAPAGTLTAFYEEMSRGRFRLTGAVYPWVRTQITMAQAVGDSYGLGGSARVGEFLIQALTLADAHIDFRLYDNDGPDGIPNSGDDDGIVDAVAFEFLEIAASCGGPSIWPHRSSIQSWNRGVPFFTQDMAIDGVPIMVNGYIIQGVTDCGGQAVQTAATIAHEYGHVLGLPDFYHPTTSTQPEHRRWVLGCWELMAAGSWGCGPVTDRTAFGPTHMMAPQKEVLGWASYDEVVGEVWDREYVLEPVQTSGRALRVPLDPEGIEALILEYRPQLGFDRVLPAGGVLITHHDREGALRPRTGFRYRMRLVEADGNMGLVRTHPEGGNRGEAGDAFGVNGHAGKLSAVTTPALLANATGRATTVSIHSVVVAEGRARVRLSTGATPRALVPERLALTQWSPPAESVRLAGGRMPYALLSASGLPPGLEARVEGDELRLVGAPRELGAFQLALRLGDSAGTAFDAVVPVAIEAFFVEQARLLQGFLGSPHVPLLPEERLHLDALGNANGALDVGDVRAWLLSSGG